MRPAALGTSRPSHSVSHGVQRKSAAVIASSTAQELALKVVERQHLSPLRVDNRRIRADCELPSARCRERVPQGRIWCIDELSGPSWTERWPDLLNGLTGVERRAVINAVADNVLEGWQPQRADLEALVDVVRGKCTTEEYIERVRRDLTTR